jgi:hypothetical protein
VDEQRTPAERVLDLIVFGPAGLALTAAEEFPRLADKGRHHLEGQIRTARLVGQVAVQMGRRQLDGLASQWRPKTSPAGSDAPRPTTTPTESSPAGDPPPPVAASGAPTPRPESEVVVAPVANAPVVNANGNGAVRPLAIPGYDSLSASQVVQRLAGLSPEELTDVRAHEQSHRHRRTILNRVEQLLSGVDAE